MNKSRKGPQVTISNDRFHELLSPATSCEESLPRKRTKITYAQYAFWIKNHLALLVKEFNQVDTLSPKVLDDNLLPIGKFEMKSPAKSTSLQVKSSIVSEPSQDLARRNEEDSQQGSPKKPRSKKMEEYKNKFVNLEPWNSNDMLVPLVSSTRSSWRTPTWTSSTARTLRDSDREST